MAGARVARRQRVVVEAVDGDVFLEIEHARLPVELAGVVGLQAELLGDLLVVGQAVGRLGGERDHARAGIRQEHGTVAAVDVAAIERLGGLVAGDRVQAEVAEVPAQARAATPGVQPGEVLAVDRHLVLVEAGHEVVAARIDDVGAEQARGAVEVALVQVEQSLERLAFVQELHAGGGLVVALEAVAGAGGVGVGHPVVLALVQRGHAGRPALAQRAADRALEVPHVVGAVGELGVAAQFTGRLGRFELHHARRRVAAEQGALRAAQHFDAFQVEHREALQQRAFLHDFVVDQRDRLRRVEVEVGIAQAADVETREGAAIGGFDVQARHAAGEEAHVVAARTQHVQLLGADAGNRDRHILDVLHLALRRDFHGVEGGGFLFRRRRGGILGEGGAERQQGGDGKGKALRPDDGRAGSGHGGGLPGGWWRGAPGR